MDTNQLDETSRQKLDGIVQKMTADKQPPRNIQAVVDDFKSKYGKAAPQPQQPITGIPGLFAGVTKGLVNSLRSVSAINAGPVGAEMLKGAPAFAAQVKQGEEATTPRGTAENIGDFAAQALIPIGGPVKEVSTVMKAKKLADASAKAIEIASPKMTPKVVQNALEQGRGQSNGLLGKMSILPDARTIKAGKSIEELTRAGKLKGTFEDAKVIHNEIGNTAEELAQRLDSMEVRPILQHTELKTLFDGVHSQISANPYLDEAATTAANKMFQLFVSKLPEGVDIDAAALLHARKVFDAEIRSMKPTAFDPKTENGTSLALRAIRHGVNDLIAAKAPDQAVKNSFAKQTALYDALENVSAKGAKEVGTTAPGRWLNKHPITKNILQVGIPSGLLGSWATSKILGE